MIKILSSLSIIACVVMILVAMFSYDGVDISWFFYVVLLTIILNYLRMEEIYRKFKK